MLSMNIDNLVHSIVLQELDGKGRENEALCFNFDLRMHYMVQNKEFAAGRGLHLLYHQRPSSTYITVFSAITTSRLLSTKKVKTWKHEATHDECWKYDNRSFHEAFMEMMDEINNEMVHCGLEAVGGDKMSQHNQFNWHTGVQSGSLRYNFFAFSWVPVEVSKDPNDEHNHRRLIKLL